MMRSSHSLLGGVAGFAFASVAAAASPEPVPSFGPALIIVMGYELPLLPALFGIIGVVATRRFAPLTAVEARVDHLGRHALTAMMVLLTLALVMSGERRPAVVIGIAGGLGYSGVAIFELLAGGVKTAARFLIDAFVSGAKTIIQRTPEKGE